MTLITVGDLQYISGVRTRSKTPAKIAAAFNKFAPKYDVTTQKRISLFLAQVAVESGGFTTLSESLNYSVDALIKKFGRHRISIADARKYGRIDGKQRANQKAIANLIYGGSFGKKNLGNVKPGDGWLFRGAGLGQITGRAHCERIARDLGIPVEDVPAILRDPEKGTEATFKLWSKWNMNDYADNDQVTASRKKWNGGDHGLSEVHDAYARGLERSFGTVKRKSKNTSVEKKNPTSKILPLFRPKQSDETTRAIVDKFFSKLSDAPVEPVQVLFVRGYYLNSMGAKGKNDRAMYDDAAFVVSPEGVQPFNANSDPSAFRKRIANLKAPQVVNYIPGKHGLSRRDGGYPAFRQNSNVTVIRDGVGEDTDRPGKRFWINLHRGGVNGTSSLGCLTIPPHQWDEFRDLVNGLLLKYGQKTFNVVLTEYSGDKPPVEVKPLVVDIEPVIVEKPPLKTGVIAITAIVALGASWWDQISTWIGSIFS